MKNFKIAVVIAALTAAPLVLAEGYGQGAGKRGGGAPAAHLQERFGVTDEQLQQMREIRESGGSREDARAILSEDQRSQIDQYRQENPRGGSGGKNREERITFMQQNFGVSDEQIQQMREIRESGGSREDARAVLSDDQRAQMQEWRQDHPRKGHGHRGRDDDNE